MKEYTGFARVYDMFMDNVPYDEWAKYLTGLLTEYGICPGRTGAEQLRDVKRAHIEASMTGDRPIIAELGCGTGSMTRRLRDAGYDMIGLDMSGEMLQIAQEKETMRTAAAAVRADGAGTTGSEGQKADTDRADSERQADDEILYLLQDMREMELYGTVAAFVSLCDSMNYITDEDDLLQVFRLVCNYLDPSGVFIFDLNTEYYYKNILGEQTICENRETGSFIWENYYDEESHINQFDLTIYNAEAEEEQLYRRYEETHYQRAWRLPEVRRLLKKAGLETAAVYGVGTHEAPARDTERIYIIAHK